MISSNNLEKIKKEIEEFFNKMTFSAQIQSFSQKDQTVLVDIKIEDPSVLIGEKGETLFEIQHLLKMILKKKCNIEDVFYLDLDINDYKKKKISYLKEMAKSLAEEVSLTKKEKILPPMPAYERRIIHLELANRSDVTTESIGQEPKRKIIIKPYP